VTQAVRHIALVPAAGSGSRFGADLPKQYTELAGRPLLAHAIARLASHPDIDRVVVILAPDDTRFDSLDLADIRPVVDARRCGGATRAESVLAGLRSLAGEVSADDWILVHDAARPCLPATVIDRLVATLADDPVGGIAALPVADTLKRADAAARIDATVSRDALWAAQTPQMFRYRVLRAALEGADLARVTDEAGAVEALGLAPRLVEGDPANLKVTYARDLPLAAHLLRAMGDAQ
jgi:2-C-methyl-D-erythritol 4-phosphate cytidylyltransferase